ncbi:hypothetical protein pben1_p51 [Paracoccus phage vB_PbeS_Pben1]|nr:hypothetical protein pben1_p51 [Paracoccus phage vB_PbeS_Pben1]
MVHKSITVLEVAIGILGSKRCWIIRSMSGTRRCTRSGQDGCDGSFGGAGYSVRRSIVSREFCRPVLLFLKYRAWLAYSTRFK